MLVLGALVAIAVGVALTLTGALQAQEQQTVDARFSIRGAQHSPRNLLVVAVDDTTFTDFIAQNLRAQWPFPRRYEAKVIDTLHRDGARQIAIDIQFTEATDPTDDNALIDAVAHAPGTVLGTTDIGPNGTNDIFGGGSILDKLHAHPGNANVPVGGNGEMVRMPVQLNGLDTFAWQTAKAADPGLRRPPQSPTWIDYAGPPGTIKTVSFSSVYDGRVPASLIRGRIVVIGPTASSLQDVHPTPFSGVMPGAEVQANAINTFLHGGPLRSVPLGVELAIAIFLGALAPVAVLLVSSRLARLTPFLAAGLYLVAAQLLFDGGWIVPVIVPMLVLATGLLAMLAVEYVMEAFERQRVYDLFSRFVPADVVKQVVAKADGARLGGVAQDCTVLFCDIRGFTTFSSTQEPQRVIDVVNLYLGEMSEAILEAGGTIAAYMGDGIFALFGAPLEQPDHADRAVTAALEMIGPRLERLNESLREAGVEHEFRIGVGLNSGPVISGNVGSERRLEYTAIGQTTNLGSRIEGATKDTPYMLLFSEDTKRALTRPRADLVAVGERQLRGAAAPMMLWTVAPPGSPEPNADLEQLVETTSDHNGTDANREVAGVTTGEDAS
jgi:adenylate cyclase